MGVLDQGCPVDCPLCTPFDDRYIATTFLSFGFLLPPGFFAFVLGLVTPSFYPLGPD